jgi:hypothetical protein
VFKPIQNRSAKIRVSLYADDSHAAAVFVNPVEEVDTVNGILAVFSLASGLRTNIGKSSVYQLDVMRSISRISCKTYPVQSRSSPAST